MVHLLDDDRVLPLPPQFRFMMTLREEDRQRNRTAEMIAIRRGMAIAGHTCPHANTLTRTVLWEIGAEMRTSDQQSLEGI